MKDAKLLGRGGAAFPTGVKWEAVARQPVQPHYFVCNADESEPGTFKDRVLMEDDPFAVVEALTIAGFATGSERGFIYLRGEYPLAAARLQGALDRAREHGLLGQDLMGRGFRFEIELRRVIVSKCHEDVPADLKRRIAVALGIIEADAPAPE